MRPALVFLLTSALVWVACSSPRPTRQDDSGPADSQPADNLVTAVDSRIDRGGAPPPDSTAPVDGDIAPGEVLLREAFEDDRFGDRGWYDGPAGALSTSVKYAGQSAFECRYRSGQTGCEGGTPGRQEFAPSETIYLSYWVRYSDNFVGSGKAYHPHEFYFLTDADGRFVGPASTHLTTYVEQVGGVPRLALQDASNVDPSCVLRNDDSFNGCDGSFDSYVFSEARSVAACNGLLGDLDERECFPSGGGWFSGRGWSADTPYFGDSPGPHYKANWHHVEAYFAMNSIVDGVGLPDGRIRYWFDGELIIASDRILMRTGEHPQLQFSQLLFSPYIGDGSPVDQSMWVDELVVSTGRPE